jgi:ParB family chromosome partitioning protein
MAAKKAKASTSKAASGRRRAPRKAKAESVGLDARESLFGEMPSDLRALVERIEREGGALVGAYRDPFGGHPLAIAVLPIGRVEPTPFQRDLSDAHHKRLADVITKTSRFLDPIVVVTAPHEGFWTPNGRHRLEAMRRLGAKAITALAVPDREIAWQILALNTEKAHNLKERSLEVIRIYRGLLAEDGARAEASFAFYLEDPALVTLGICYEKQPRFAGGAYHPVLRRTEHFSDAPIDEAIREHEPLADAVLDLEAKVAAAVARLKARGLTSPYLRSFVVARINPLRWLKGDLPPAASIVAQMASRASKFNVERVKQEDLAHMGGAPDEDAS